MIRSLCSKQPTTAFVSALKLKYGTMAATGRARLTIQICKSFVPTGYYRITVVSYVSIMCEGLQNSTN